LSNLVVRQSVGIVRYVFPLLPVLVVQRIDDSCSYSFAVLDWT
jgi:hypothetical protein